MRDELEALARDVAHGRVTVDAAQRRTPSTSQQCLLALVGGEPWAAPKPYDGGAADAWGRLDDEQRAIVERVAPDVVERYGLRRCRPELNRAVPTPETPERCPDMDCSGELEAIEGGDQQCNECRGIKRADGTFEPPSNGSRP